MVNSQELNKSISDLQIEVKKFKSISDVYTEIASLKSDLIKLQEQNKISSDKIKTVTEALESKLGTYEKLLNDLYRDNKDFHKDLEQHITSKLENHSSNIQQFIRSESTQIQRSLELALKENNLQLTAKVAKANQIQIIFSAIITLLVISVLAFMKYKF